MKHNKIWPVLRGVFIVAVLAGLGWFILGFGTIVRAQQANHTDDQYIRTYLSSLTNVTSAEMFEFDSLRQNQIATQARGDFWGIKRLPSSELPTNYGQMTQAQKDVYEILYLAAKKVEEDTAYYTNLYANNKAALLQPKPIPLHPWRKINRKPIYVLSSDSGFVSCGGTVIQSIDGGVLVKPFLDISGNYFIKNFPFQVEDGYTMDASLFMAKRVGVKKYTSVLGSDKTVTEFDYGEPCERPQGGEKIEADALTPTPYNLKQLQEIESSLTEKLNVAAAAKKRVADFIQKIEDDKNEVINKREQRQQHAKDIALKSNQDQAAKGDAYGLLRMGERYRDADGVEMDLTKAHDYLTKAAAAGSPTAAADLSKLKQISTNSPTRQ